MFACYAIKCELFSELPLLGYVVYNNLDHLMWRLVCLTHERALLRLCGTLGLDSVSVGSFLCVRLEIQFNA